MASQSTNRHNEAKAKREAQACMLLQRAFQKAMDDSLEEKDQAKYLQIYLSKTLPDLKAVEHSGDAANPMAVTLVSRVIHDPAHNPNP